MKKHLLAATIILLLSLLVSPTLNLLHAYKGLVLAKSYRQHSANYSRTDRPGDFKIPDISISNDTGFIKRKTWKGPKSVVIDAGHGGMDPGTNIEGLNEKDINLDVALRLNSILSGWGILNYMTRSSDDFIDLKERIYTANDKGAALFISIHSNWFNDPSSNGTMTLYYPSDELCAGHLTESEYARTIQGELIKTVGTNDRGIIEGPGLAVLRHAQMPSVIVELGFISNASDAALLASEDFRQKAAEGLAEGIKKALSKI